MSMAVGAGRNRTGLSRLYLEVSGLEFGKLDKRQESRLSFTKMNQTFIRGGKTNKEPVREPFLQVKTNGPLDANTAALSANGLSVRGLSLLQRCFGFRQNVRE